MRAQQKPYMALVSTWSAPPADKLDEVSSQGKLEVARAPIAAPTNAHALTNQGATVGFGESRHAQRNTTADLLRTRLLTGVRLRLPPFGKDLCAELRKGHEPNVRLFCGHNAWSRAKRWRREFGPGSALVLPADIDPGTLRWPSICGLIVYFPDDSPGALERKRALASALIRDGVGFVLMTHQGHLIRAGAAKEGE